MLFGALEMARRLNSVDVHVGRRIRAARLAKGMSQERLAESLGVTFQQVQKYEKGVNRVGAGRLHYLAKTLTVPISYFFEDAAGVELMPATNEGFDAITEALSTKEGIRIARALARIREPEVRRRIADLLDAMVTAQERQAVA